MSFLVGVTTRNWARENGIGAIYLDQTASTNTDARLFDGQFKTMNIILTDSQTQGRGRGANQWETPGIGDYLLSSWVQDCAQAPQPIFSARIGLALFQAAKIAWPELAWGLKAPNDLFIGSKKIAGLLIEVISQAQRHRIIIGLGFNVARAPELDTASCLNEELDREASLDEWNQFLRALAMKLHGCLKDSSRTVLNFQECEDLKAALNAYPPLQGRVLGVQNDAGLILSDGHLKWNEL